MTPGHYIDGFERTYTDCPWRDRHIACDFLNATDPFVWLRAGAHTAPLSTARYMFDCAVPFQMSYPHCVAAFSFSWQICSHQSPDIDQMSC